MMRPSIFCCLLAALAFTASCAPTKPAATEPTAPVEPKKEEAVTPVEATPLVRPPTRMKNVPDDKLPTAQDMQASTPVPTTGAAIQITPPAAPKEPEKTPAPADAKQPQ